MSTASDTVAGRNPIKVYLGWRQKQNFLRKSMISIEPASWIGRYGDSLFSLALLKVGDRSTAEDLVQETFIAGLRARDSFKGESSEKTWLVTILKNKIIDYYRKKDVLKNASQYLAETDDEFSNQFFDSSNGHWLKNAAPHTWPESADAPLNNSEFERVLQACMHKMPPRLVPVFVAKFIDNEDSETICKVHGISSSNYWVIVHRAKVLIRSCLEKNWFLTKMPK